MIVVQYNTCLLEDIATDFPWGFLAIVYIYLFGVLHQFQHYTGHDSWLVGGAEETQELAAIAPNSLIFMRRYEVTDFHGVF